MHRNFGLHIPTSMQAVLGMVFLLLTATLTSLVVVYWLWVLEPRLEDDALAKSNVMAQSHSWVLSDTLSSEGSEKERIQQLGWAIDEILVLTDPSTGEPFIEGINVELDQSLIGEEITPEISRGNTVCLNCFVSDIPLYSKESRELFGIATFYSNSSFFEQLREEVRQRLYLTMAIFVLLISLAWWFIHSLLTRSRRNDALLSQTFDAMSFPVISASIGLESIIRSNQSAQEIFSAERITAGASLRSIFFDNHDFEVLQKAIYMSKTVDGYECQLRDANGASYWALISITQVDFHALPAVILSIADITQLKHAEAVIRESEERFSTVLDSLDDLVYVADMESYELLFMNKATRKLVGNRNNAMCWDVLHEDQNGPCSFCTTEKIMDRNGNPSGVYSWSYFNIHTNEWYTCTDRAIRWVDGRTVRLETATNITELKQTQLALEAAKDEAETASKAKSEFLATMSHEIRTPLNGIIGMVKLLMRSSPRDDQVEYIDAINLSSEQLLLLINDILDISKIEAGKLYLEPRDFNLNALIDETIKLFELPAQEKGLKLEATITPTTPNFLHADATRLRQVLLNLVSNAIKFTYKGSVRVVVDGQVLNEQKVLINISVSDTGIGIPASRASQIFDEFTQLDMGTARRYEGTGLGLAISKRLITAMGGTIRLSSSSNEGSTFSVTLEMPQAKELPADVSHPPEPAAQARSLHILLAEDNAINSKVAKTLLEQDGHTVQLAINGIEVVEALQEEDFDLILMDLHMPIMDGIEATREVRDLPDKQKASIPIIALTANIMQEERERCLEVGMNNFLAKPFTPEKLEEVIGQTINSTS